MSQSQPTANTGRWWSVHTSQGVIQDFDVGGNKVAREARRHLGVVWGHAPPPHQKLGNRHSEVNSVLGCLFSHFVFEMGQILSKLGLWVCA